MAGVSATPAGSNSAPRRKSKPCLRTLWPTGGVFSKLIWLPLAVASSCMITASAPIGSGAPVKMRTHWPCSIMPTKRAPACDVPASFSGRPGTTSAARTA